MLRNQRGTSIAFIAMASVFFLGFPIFSQTTTAKDPDCTYRYSIKKAGDAVIRLDALTGSMSICVPSSPPPSSKKWSCTLLEDDRMELLNQIKNLQERNKNLIETVKKMKKASSSQGEDRSTERDKKKEENSAQSPFPNFKIPEEKDIDSALNYLDKLIKKFRDRFENFDSTPKGTEKNDSAHHPASHKAPSISAGFTKSAFVAAPNRLGQYPKTIPNDNLTQDRPPLLIRDKT